MNVLRCIVFLVLLVTTHALWCIDIESMGSQLSLLLNKGDYQNAAIVSKGIVEAHLTDQSLEQREPWAVAAAYHELGNKQMADNDYLSAFHNILKAKELASQYGFGQLVVSSDINLGILYSLYGDIPNTLSHHLEAMHLATQKELNQEALLAFRHILVETILDAPGNKTFMQALRLHDKIPDNKQDKTAKAIHALAVAWSDGDLAEAMRHAQEWIETSKGSTRDARCILGILQQKANAKRQALKTFLQLVEDNPDTSTPIIAYAVHNIMNLYGELGQSDSAYLWWQRYNAMDSAIFSQQRYGAVRDMLARIEQEKANQQISSAKAQRDRAMAIVWIAVGFVVLLATGATVIFLQNRELRRKDRSLFQKADKEITESKVKKNIGDSATPNDELAQRIRTVMDDPKLVSDPDFSLTTLAHHCGVSEKIVSQTIHQTTNLNFSTLLADSRVRLAQLSLRSPESANLTIEAVAQSVGFRSRSNFAVQFRRVTGLTPHQYRKLAFEKGQNE